MPPTVVVAPEATVRPASEPPARRSQPAIPTLMASGADSAPVGVDTTLVGPMTPPRPPASRPPSRPPRPAATRPPSPRLRPNATPQIGTLPSAASLREAYPALRRAPPSPMRPQPNVFDDRPPSSVGTGRVFDMTRTVRRDAYVRHLLIGIAVALAVLVALLVYN